MADRDHVILKIKLNCFDVDFFSNGIELSPWLEILYDDVIFPSGEWTMHVDEQIKIDNVLPEIRDAVAKYGKLIPLGLYISGHTDTMGDGFQ